MTDERRLPPSASEVVVRLRLATDEDMENDEDTAEDGEEDEGGEE